MCYNLLVRKSDELSYNGFRSVEKGKQGVVDKEPLLVSFM